jgi:hypothetical protein
MAAGLSMFSSQTRKQAEQEKKQQQQQADLIKQIAEKMGVIPNPNPNKISGK